ncbi:unnamed protein product [Adineta steineri]|uniref:DUF866-domain-containing protein n=1 Tax=Adineta steineri TaxID=433720 RepID=A0A818QCB1_9BILA|nr:unnamed protein product [Adineta steineri]
MVKIALQFKATLDNVTDFHIASLDDFIWYLKLECSKCHTQSDNYHDMTLKESSNLVGSRGEANFIMKCKFCSSEGNINIEPVKPAMNYTSDDSDNHSFKTLVIFDCRGIEPTDWQPGDGWTCQGAESSTKFNQIDLSENKEWMDYDEKTKQAVAVNEVEFKFIKVK